MKLSVNEAQKKPCVIFVANRSFALTNSRLLLIQHFLSSGWQVVAVTAKDEYLNLLTATGATIELIPFNRGGLALSHDIKALLRLSRIYSQYHPHLIHHFHAKPIIFGSLAAYLMNRVKVVNTVTGLGYAFTAHGVTHYLAAAGYRSLLSRSDATIFQNSDDRQFFLERGWISSDKAPLIVSSGVDLECFYPATLTQPKAVHVLMVARLLWQKGVREFVEAAEIIKKKYPTVCFQLAGEWDPIHPDAVDKAWLQAAVDAGIIDFLGYLKNMPAQLRATDIFVLPSYYLEGVPRVLLEAAASGVPVVTTDMPGCREVVIDGETGRLVPPQNSKALAEAITELLNDPVRRQQMGQASRSYMEAEFDIRAITEKHFAIYRSIGVNI